MPFLARRRIGRVAALSAAAWAAWSGKDWTESDVVGEVRSNGSSQQSAPHLRGKERARVWVRLGGLRVEG
jgi:hypothetical protein